MANTWREKNLTIVSIKYMHYSCKFWELEIKLETILYIYCMLVREIWINFHIYWTRMLYMFYYTEWNQENTYMWNTAGKHILSPLERCLSFSAVAIVTVACKWCVPSASDVFLSKNYNSGGENLWGIRGGGIWFLFHEIWFLSCVITCSDFYPLSNQINLFMVINIWGIIIKVRFATHTGFMMTPSRNISILQKKISL